MKHLLVLFLSFCYALGLNAQGSNDVLFTKALNAYKAKDYKQSVEIFEKLIKVDSLNPTLHYNLGTAYLREQKTGLSIYHLEKSLKLQPNYEAARINLNFAEKLKTNITKGNLPIPQQQMLYSVFNFLKPNTWAYLAIGLMVGSVVLLIGYRLTTNTAFKKALFIVGIFSLFMSVGSYFISKNQSTFLLKNNYVIINNKDTSLLNEPRSASKITTTLVEGEKGFIKEQTNQWVKIQLQNDTIGWVHKNNVLLY